jgi:predicted site-specific integrase-resolvase
MSDSKHYQKIGESSKLLGVSKSTLRIWADEKTIDTIRTPGGQRLYNVDSFIGKATTTKNKKAVKPRTTILYSRVSSVKQKDDLARQKTFIRDTFFDKYPEQKTNIGAIQEVTDVGSGINFKRRGLLQVLGQVKSGGISAVVVASKDRLARFGFELIEWLCTECDCKIIILDNQDGAPEEELGKDLMAIVQVYCCRWNGKRRYSKQPNPTVQSKSIQVETKPNNGTKAIA